MIPSLLRQCPILEGLSDVELQIFLNRVLSEDFPAGEEILTEGLRYHSLWILVSGEVEVLKKGHHRLSRLATLGPGNVFGEMSFLDGTSHSATVKARVPCQTIRLMHDAYEDLRQVHPEIAHRISLNLVRILSDRLRHMDAWTCELVEKECDEKRHDEWQQFRSKLYAMKEL
jgi:CRP-like cAMP-binding protein